MATGDVTVVPARPGDAGRVARLQHDFNTEFDTPVPDVDVLTARLERMLARDDVLVLLAEPTPGDAVGFALVTFRPTPFYDGPLAQLEELYVRPQLRDQGIGTAIMAALDREATARDCGEILINVDEGDTDTRRFYERLGFVNTDQASGELMLCYLRELASDA